MGTKLISLDTVKAQLSEYIDNKNCAYKTLYNGKEENDEKYYICVLESTDDTINNEKRDNVINKNSAQFRGSEFLVVHILDLSDPEEKVSSVNHITNLINTRVTTLYEVGKKVIANNYNKNNDIICGAGISYFLTVDAAYYYEKRYIAIKDKYTGHWEEFYPNGELMVGFEMVGGKIHGDYVILSSKGKISVVTKYVNGTVIENFGWHDSDEKIQLKQNKNKINNKININKINHNTKPKCCQ